MTRRIVTLLAPLTVALLAAPAAAVAATPGTAPGATPLTTTQDLFVGGTYSQAGNRVANNIARWPGVDWGALGGPNGNGTNGQVSAITVYNGKLIAAGSFTTAGGLTVNGIAAWDGQNWSALTGSSGIPGLIHFDLDFVATLVVYNGNLYAGGQFVAAGGTLQVNNIVEWNGSDWVGLTDRGHGTGATLGGSPVGGAVFSLTVYNNTLVAGGGFDAAGGIAANRVASWNGTTWSPLSLPEPNGETVLALTVFNGQLIADDEFVQNNLDVQNVDAFNGTSWTQLGASFNNEIRTFTVYNNKLIAGGFFTAVGSTTANHIAQWDGTSWSALPGPVEGNAVIYSLGVTNGLLVAGGDFVEMGGTTATNLAEWNGTSWSAVRGAAGEGTNGTVFALFSTTVL